MLKIMINGFSGQMGQAIAEQIEYREDMELVAGIVTDVRSYAGDIKVYDDIRDFDGSCDVIVDFSHPNALDDLLGYARDNSIALVIGTTGYGDKDIAKLEKAAKDIPILYSANMSLGINLLLSLVYRAANILNDDFDIEIIEKHHNQKIDAPSGTAYMIADRINEAFENGKTYIFGRHTKTDKRTPKEIGIHAIRGGTIVGEHTVLFAGLDEVLEIKHEASSKGVFAKGALRAAEFIIDKDKGLFDMDDLIGR
ncbi:MAG: 4-hydroxy-tetrahydrodipicolinate reductase [Tissierellia bacterium]|nr:4-hydroxy-tetrahydrodipicolinate reductase [Tissierellia bacterium]